MELPFEKWHGCLNDFIVFHLQSHHIPMAQESIKRQTQKMCSREGNGIGADGVLLIVDNDNKDTSQLIIINSDGSIAKHCGNGTRCAALSVYRKKTAGRSASYEQMEHHTFLIEGREIDCYFAENRRADLPAVSIAMGQPKIDNAITWSEKVRTEISNIFETNQFLANYQLHLCELSNPHAVILLDDCDDPMAKIRQIGPALQNLEALDGLNVHIAFPYSGDRSRPNSFSHRISESYNVFSWERGAGLTSACGSGACAVAAVLLDTDLIPREEWIEVRMPGGIVYVKQDEKESSAILSGPAEFVYKGIYDI